MILQFGLQIILPVVLLYGLWRGVFGSRAEWLLNVAAVGAGLAFVFLTARWDFTSYYLRIVLPLLLAAAAAMSYRRISRGPGERQRPKLPATLTNLVVLLAFVYLCVRSITVAAGMRVEVGDVLGQVGNSGNSSQPHLHLHAERGGEPEEILTGAGVPIELGGRFLVRNSLFTGGDE